MLADSIIVTIKLIAIHFLRWGRANSTNTTNSNCLFMRRFFLCRKSAPSWILFESVILQNKIIVMPKSKVDIPDSNIGKPRMN